MTHLADYAYLGRAAVVLETEPQPQLQYTLVGTAGGNDPDTGDIYRGLDRFGRIKDLLWYNTGTSATAEEVQHGYDRASNRLWRADPADQADQHDELYGYDALDRLTNLQRGSLNAGRTGLTALTLAQCWALDATGNWRCFRQDSSGSGTWNLAQNRTANTVNEITGITTMAGSAWVGPVYSPAGEATTFPQPAAPNQVYTATYDAWHRLVGLSAGGTTVAAYQYDGMGRRTVKQTYSGGVLSETRHQYYTVAWQVLEERVGTASVAERQFVWGVRHVDDLVLRDRDPSGGGALSERLYAMQDANWNVTALADSTGVVQERYAYDGYGVPMVLTAGFDPRASSAFAWETQYAGYRWDGESGLYQVRRRPYHPGLGCFLSRDPRGGSAGGSGPSLYRYGRSNPLAFVDPSGELDPGTGTVVVVGGATSVTGGGAAAGGGVGSVVGTGGTVIVVGGALYVVYLVWQLGDATLDYWAAQETAASLEAELEIARALVAEMLTKCGPKAGPKPEPKPEPKPNPDEWNPPPPPPQPPKTCATEYPGFYLCNDFDADHDQLFVHWVRIQSQPGITPGDQKLVEPGARVACAKCWPGSSFQNGRMLNPGAPCSGRFGGRHFKSVFHNW